MDPPPAPPRGSQVPHHDEFIAPKNKIVDFGAVRAGFTPALPLIPMSLMGQIVAFFRSFMQENDENEAMAIIFWDKAEQHFFAYVPKQTVTKEQIDADLTECPYPRSRFHRDDAEVSAQERGN